MCGILVTVPNYDENLFKIALDSIKHRGPDGYGIWSDKEYITLGHRRLSILDLSVQANQPMHYRDRYTVVFNGEIYNFIELKKELIGKGYNFYSESDTEVLLLSYIEWGNNCLLKFNGMWSFAIWDSCEKTLFLSRDRFGIKPLFYSIIDQRFVFASEMKAIFPFLKEVKPSKNLSWFINNIYSYEGTEECVIENIKRFPPGHYGIYKNKNLQIYRYWNTLDHLIEVSGNYSEEVEYFKEIFIDACKIRMRSDVPIGTALSGGLDSSATISTMAYLSKNISDIRMTKNWQHAFIASFPGTPLDETYYAKKVVEHIGIKANFINIDVDKGFDKIEEYLYLFEDLYITSPIPFIQLYAEMRKNGVVVTVDGHGSDELFCGYEHSILSALPDCRNDMKKFHEVVKTYQDVWPKDKQFDIPDSFSIYKNYFLSNYRSGFKQFIKIILGKNNYDYIKKKLRKDNNDINNINKNTLIADLNKSNHPGFKKMDNLNKHLYHMVHASVLPTLLRNYDRYSMINSVEVRMPFLDYRIVVYGMSLPWNSKIRDGFTKKIVRDAIGSFMPDEVTYRKTKIGFTAPTVDWMKKKKEIFLDVVNSQDFKNCELIDAKSVKKSVEDVISDPNVKLFDAEVVWLHFMLYLWEKAVIKRYKK